MSGLIYKQGQGHWTRLMSAIGGSALIAATALWVGGQIEARVDRETFGVEPAFIELGAVVIIAAGLGVLLFWLVYGGRGSGEFLIATEGEMKKVNWSTRKEVFGSTRVVIVISLMIALILFVVDFLFSSFFRSIGLLKT